MIDQKINGVITAVVTPFKQNKELDIEAFHKLIRFQKEAGINGVMICGSTGENPTLTKQEKITLIKEALKHKTDKFKIYANTGSNDTLESIEFTKEICSITEPDSIDGIMAVVPYYNKPCQRGIEAHFKAIANAVPNTSMIIYNVPSRTGASIEPITFFNVVEECSNVVAIKEAAGVLNNFLELNNMRKLKNKEYVSILTGEDSNFAAALLCGGNGIISVTANAFPTIFVNIMSNYDIGNMQKLEQNFQKSYEISKTMFIAPNPVPVKYVLNKLGITEQHVRLPLVDASENHIQQINKTLEKYL